ncbi:MAG: DedA family protein [Deltaproteobacteria bacterium]|nr:DedA family protein [Deltaproteobacteria bacterium]
MDIFLYYLHSLPNYLIYLLLGISAFVENIFPPIPGDTITAFGAFLVGIGGLDFFGVYLSTTIGSLLGFMSLFWIGTYLGRRFFIKREYRFFKAADIIRAEEWFKRYGYFMITLNRFLPGLRSAISVAGGISGLRSFRVTILALASCATWNLIWIFMGYILGNNWEMVEAKISTILVRYNLSVLILFILFVIFLIIRKWCRRKR